MLKHTAVAVVLAMGLASTAWAGVQSTSVSESLAADRSAAGCQAGMERWMPGTLQVDDRQRNAPQESPRPEANTAPADCSVA